MKFSEEIEVERGSKEWHKYRSHISGSNGDKVTIHYNADGSINEKETYTNEYREKLAKKRDQQSQNSNKKGKKGNEQNEKKKDGCLIKIIKGFFKLLWWIIKLILTIVTLGLISDLLKKDK